MIFYFSGTGNTQWVAEHLARATADRTIPIAGKSEGKACFNLSERERIGFCFPIHGWRPPKILRNFIRNLSFANADGHYCYAVCTCGDETGLAIDILNKDLGAIGLHTDSAFSIAMPNTYVCLPFMDTDGTKIEARKTDAARKTLDTISQSVADRQCGVFALKKGQFPSFLSYVLGKYFSRQMVTDKHFFVDEPACSKCGICARACPIGNIRWSPGRLPEWERNGKCTCCLACYHHCPNHAVCYGKATRGKGQYFFGKETTK